MTTPHSQRLVSVAEIASLLGFSDTVILEMLDRRNAPVRQDYFSIKELATRWRCSRGTVYNRLRAAGARVLDFSTKGKKSKKAVALGTVMQIENRQTKRLA